MHKFIDNIVAFSLKNKFFIFFLFFFGHRACCLFAANQCCYRYG